MFLCSSNTINEQGKETNSGGYFCHPRGMLHGGCDFPFTRSVGPTYIFFLEAVLMVTFTSKMEHRGNLWSDQQSTDFICESNKHNRSGICRLGNVWNVTLKFFPSAVIFLTLCSDVLSKSQLLWVWKEAWFVFLFLLQIRGWKAYG